MILLHLAVVFLVMKVGCDGILGSEQALDKCGVCGGDDTTCHIISGIFTRSKLPYGYTHVARIPRGACNINITELYPTTNYLALRLTHGKYLINGNWKLGPSKDEAGAGSTLRYYRPAPADARNKRESILIEGPTNSSLDVLVVSQTANRGIMYSFTIPMDSKASPADNHDNQNNDKDSNNNKDIQADDVVPANPQYMVSNSNSLTYKTAPKYVKPEYDNERLEQTQALNDEASRAAAVGASSAREVSSQQKAVAPAAAAPAVPTARRTRLEQSEYRRKQRERAQRRRHRQSAARRTSQNAPPGSSSRQSSYVPSSRSAPSVKTYNRPDSASSSQPRAGQSPIRTASQTRISSQNRAPQQVPDRSQYGVNYGATQGTNGVQYYSNGERRTSGGVQDARNVAANPNSPQSADNNRAYPLRGHSANTAGANGQRGYPSYTGSQPQPGVNYGAQSGGQSPSNGYNRQVYPTYRSWRYQAPASRNAGSPLIVNQQPVYIPPQQQPSYGNQGLQLSSQQNRGYPQYAQGNSGLGIPDSAGVQLGTLDVSAEYSWKISGFTECSRTCGGGTQTTIIVCVKVDSQTVVTDNNCDVNKPTPTTVTCNNNLPCPPGWAMGPWSECSTTCGRGTTSRTVECKRRVSSTLEFSVSAAQCTHERRPETMQVCNEDTPCVRWLTGDWGQCSAECGRGQRSRQVLCVDTNDAPVPENKCDDMPKPAAAEICDMGSCARTWFFTEWSSECSNMCGEGVQRRAVYCGAPEDRCSAISKPDTIKPCENEVPCGGKWFTGPWTDCSVSCGPGVVSRDVVCMKKLGRALTVLGEENCVMDEKPATTQPCELVPCGPKWFMTQWTDCTRQCSTGTQTREVKCLTPDQRISSSCSQAEKPVLRQACNTQPCSGSGRGDPPPPDTNCQDEFKNCRLVVQARLCQYDYYKGLCCHSCTEYERLHP